MWWWKACITAAVLFWKWELGDDFLRKAEIFLKPFLERCKLTLSIMEQTTSGACAFLASEPSFMDKLTIPIKYGWSELCLQSWPIASFVAFLQAFKQVIYSCSVNFCSHKRSMVRGGKILKSWNSKKLDGHKSFSIEQMPKRNLVERLADLNLPRWCANVCET